MSKAGSPPHGPSSPTWLKAALEMQICSSSSLPPVVVLLVGNGQAWIDSSRKPLFIVVGDLAFLALDQRLVSGGTLPLTFGRACTSVWPWSNLVCSASNHIAAFSEHSRSLGHHRQNLTISGDTSLALELDLFIPSWLYTVAQCSFGSFVASRGCSVEHNGYSRRHNDHASVLSP